MIDKINENRILYCYGYKYKEFTSLKYKDQFIETERIVCFLTYFPFMELFLKFNIEFLNFIKE